MATPGNLRKIHLAAARASDEVANYLFGFFNTEVAKALRSTIIRFDKIPKTMAERDELLTEALAAAAAAVEKVSADAAQRLQPDQIEPFRAKAHVDAEAAVREIIAKIFPLAQSLAQPQPAPQPQPQPSGLPARLTQREIEEIVNMPQSQLRRVGSGGFGQTYKVVSRGRTYLRKDIQFHGEDFTKWSFGTEVKYLELVCSHPLYSLIPLTPYYFGSMIRGGTGYIIEELFSGANLDDVLMKRNLTADEVNFIIMSLDFYVHRFFHQHLGILHLDLKPLNIFVRMHENKIVSVHLLDLGLTRAIGEVGLVAGTADFMSPAQHAARRTGVRTIKHIPEFNTYALDRIYTFIRDAQAPVASIKEINVNPLVPRPWEADIPMSVTNVLCSIGLMGVVETETISTLLSIPGADINKLSEEGNTPLIVALANKNKITAVSYIRSGADVNLRNTRGATPLHWAASQGLFGALKLLLDDGADKDALTFPTDPWEPMATPLHWACKAGQPNTATALLTAGANLTLRDGNGESVLDLAKKKRDVLIDFMMLLEAYKQRTGANMGGRRTRRNRRLRNKKR